MKIDLKEYLTRRHKASPSSPKKKPGPVITISRQYGCEANALAEKLAKLLGKSGHEWKIINKEILEESSRELHMHPVKMKQAFTPHEKSYVEEMFNSFTLNVEIPSRKIYGIIEEVIHNYAEAGHVIIVGRGGVGITRDIEKSLHIRLIAPEEHRVRLISEKRNTTLKRAREIVSSQDKRRMLFIQLIRGEVVDQSIFDLLLNTVTLRESELMDIILAASASKKLI